jgi:hypothetical protein
MVMALSTWSDFRRIRKRADRPKFAPRVQRSRLPTLRESAVEAFYQRHPHLRPKGG